jgi:hypothetical protein
MGRWRRQQQGGIHHQEAQGARSQNRKPPVGMYAFWAFFLKKKKEKKILDEKSVRCFLYK